MEAIVAYFKHYTDVTVLVAMPYSLVYIHRRFGTIHDSVFSLSQPENVGSTFFRNVGESLPDYTVSSHKTVIFIGTAVSTSNLTYTQDRHLP